jgi:hypothetical protein
MPGIMEQLMAWGLTTLVAAFIGSYLAGYLKQKGENLATHEDINKLVEQLEATTTATKSIEARFSNEVWDRQKRWEMTREISLEVLRTIGKASTDLKYASAALIRVTRNEASDTAATQASQSFGRCFEFVLTLGSLRMMVVMVSGAEVITAFMKVEESYAAAVSDLNFNTFKREEAQARLDEFGSAVAALQYAIRGELKIPLPEQP